MWTGLVIAAALLTTAPASAAVYVVNIESEILSGVDDGKDVAGKNLSFQLRVDTALYDPANPFKREGVDFDVVVDGRPINFLNDTLPDDIIWGAMTASDDVRIYEYEVAPPHYPTAMDLYGFEGLRHRQGWYDACVDCNVQFETTYNVGFDLFSLGDLVDGQIVTPPREAAILPPSVKINLPYDGYVYYQDRTCAFGPCPLTRDVLVYWRTTNFSVSVPEPSAWALMIAGFGLSGAMIRRRRQPRSEGSPSS